MNNFYVGTLGVTVDDEDALVRIIVDAPSREATYELLDSTGALHSWTWDLSETEPETFQDLAFMALIAYTNHIYGSTNGLASCSVIHSAMGLRGLARVVDHVSFHKSAPPLEGVTLQ